ncbi:MAG: radical SAM protein [Proteocatella sp.]
MKVQAQFYEIKGNKVRCKLCPHRCTIAEGKRGICRVREAGRNEAGDLMLYTLNYGEISSIAMDPIEKKPLIKFHPGSEILSIGTYGCNLGCLFCQNYFIAHGNPKTSFLSPQDMLKRLKAYPESLGLAFTYNEPTIWYEYVYDTSVLIRKLMPEKKIVLVTNGYINEEPLRKLLPYVDAMNIDLKGDDNFYRRICAGTMPEVMNSIRIANEMGVHVEVTTLLVGTENTNEEQLVQIGEFIKSVNPQIVLHISRYFPHYKMDIPATEINVMKKAYRILKKILPNVEVGNLTYSEKLHVTEE